MERTNPTPRRPPASTPAAGGLADPPAGAAGDTRLERPRRPGGRRASRAAPRPPRRVRRRRATVRKVDPWSVLKLSLIFYVCALLIAMLGLAVFWAVINRLGVIDTVTDLAGSLNLAIEFNGSNIARALFLIGLLNVVLWSGINVFLAFLYNLVADLIGGLEITLAEDE